MKYLFIILLCVAVSTFSSCNDNESAEPNYGDFSPEIGKLLASAGNIPFKEAKYEVETIRRDSLDSVIYDNPETNREYEAYPVTTEESYSIVDNPMEYATLNPWASLWPGALVQGSSLTNGGVPINLHVSSDDRLPGNIYLAMVSGEENQDEWFKQVPMSEGHVAQARDELLENIYNQPAHTAFEIRTVKSTEDLALQLGINFKMFGQKLNSTFGRNWSEKKSYVAVKLNQIFFTMSYEDPSFGKVFTDGVTAQDLAPYVSIGNPACYVSSVSYGRSFIMLYESSKSTLELELALQIAIKMPLGIAGDTDFTYAMKETINESTVTAIQIGGDPVSGLEAIMGDVDDLKTFLVKGANVSRDNIGSPISYKINHLYDNTNVVLSNTLEYTVKNKTFLPVKPRGDIFIDIFDASVDLRITNDKSKISNHSDAIIHGIRVQLYDGGELIRNRSISLNRRRHSTKGGARIPIYQTSIFSAVLHGKDNPRIRIETDVEIYNQSYHGGTAKGTYHETLISQFEYDRSSNSWKPIDSNSDFSSISVKTPNIANIIANFKLNYRFRADGLIYPNKKDSL